MVVWTHRTHGKWSGHYAKYKETYQAHYQRNREKYARQKRESYLRNRERVNKIRRTPEYRAYDRQLRYNRKLDVLRMLGGKCANCGCSDPSLLQVNHIHGGGIADHRENGAAAIYTQIRNGTRPLNDYDLRCAICNWLYYLDSTKPELAKRYTIKFL